MTEYVTKYAAKRFSVLETELSENQLGNPVT